MADRLEAHELRMLLKPWGSLWGVQDYRPVTERVVNMILHGVRHWSRPAYGSAIARVYSIPLRQPRHLQTLQTGNYQQKASSVGKAMVRNLRALGYARTLTYGLTASGCQFVEPNGFVLKFSYY